MRDILCMYYSRTECSRYRITSTSHCQIVYIQIKYLDSIHIKCILEYIVLFHSIGKEICDIKH